MPLDPARWEDLPRPVGFVLSGGATLGALQVGMLRALATAGIEPDLVAGTSVGALNGAVVADIGLPGPAADVLEVTWRAMTTASVFPGGRIRQAWRLARRLSVYPDTGLRDIISSTLGPVPTFEGLALPFAAVATDVLGASPRRSPPASSPSRCWRPLPSPACFRRRPLTIDRGGTAA